MRACLAYSASKIKTILIPLGVQITAEKGRGLVECGEFQFKGHHTPSNLTEDLLQGRYSIS